jgi:hypothetical protein
LLVVGDISVAVDRKMARFRAFVEHGEAKALT